MEDSNKFKIPNRSDSAKKLNRVFGDSMKYIPFNTATKYSGGPVLFLLEQVLQLKYANQYELIDANISRSNQCTRLKNFFNQHHHHIDKGKLKALFNSISIEKDLTKSYSQSKILRSLRVYLKKYAKKRKIFWAENLSKRKLIYHHKLVPMRPLKYSLI